MKKLLFLLIGFFVGLEGIEFRHPEKEQLTFEYSLEAMGYLKGMPKPEEKITNEQLEKINREVEYVILSSELPQEEQLILPAYIANAQKDFAWLTYFQTGSFTGDLAPATLWTLQLFIPDAKLPSAQEDCFDVYTCSLASVVVSKAANRLEAEKKQIHEYAVQNGGNRWRPTSPGYRGRNFGSVKTWFLTSADEHVTDAPAGDKKFWKSQCEMIKKEQKQLNNDKVTAVFEWAGLTHLDAGSWKKILDDYLDEKNASVAERLYIRSLFLSAILDSTASAFHSKYTFWVMRPSQFDQDVKPYVKIPNHPSYPSAHSTVSTTAAVVLSAIYPEDKARWNAIAEEAGMSRIWGGIHYPADHTAGKELGRHVGETILKRT